MKLEEVKEVTIFDIPELAEKYGSYAGKLFEGDVDLSRTKITSLKGLPSHISGSFYCIECKNLTSLIGAPELVEGVFYCNHSPITSLVGAPKYIGESIQCIGTKISSFEGAPKHIGNNFYCYDAQIKTLHNIQKYVKFIGNSFACNNNVTHVLGLLEIDGLRSVVLDSARLDKIIFKHLKGDRDIFACQDELIEAGYIKEAKL